MYKYDLVVVGTGVAGSTAAYSCREEGMIVAVIDKMPFGGTCALRGCDPKKVLVGAAELMDRIERMKGLGIQEGSKISWEDLMAFKRTFVDGVPKRNEEAYEKADIDMYHGTAVMTSKNQIQVNNHNLTFDRLLIAAGARPQLLHFTGEEHLLISDDFLELEHLPKKLVFVGGGFISFEFAHIAALAGAEVHILQRSDKPLKNFDEELVKLLVRRSEEMGIKVHLNAAPFLIEKKEDHYLVYADQDGESILIECDRAVHGGGRVPDIYDMDLEKGNVEYDRHGIRVNEYLQSISNHRVYAAGDAAATRGLPLTPVAGKESAVVAENIWLGNGRKVHYGVMPSIVFTQPKLAIIGLTEERAARKGYDVSVNRINTKNWYTYKRTNEPYAMVKTVVNNKTGKLLGVHILGSNADELINYFALIMKFDLPYDEVSDMIFAYPTSASDLKHLLK
ncbi:dihydrolipoyl dehydrogenase family protein [Proteiniclasticum sp. C24MP]|uniref:dihydrolipoyl dehydrogenase family protein n=1 Tax=Proteiniclasticum sp. C24MP TaxID=3374101 RepID=UPI003755323C